MKIKDILNAATLSNGHKKLSKKHIYFVTEGNNIFKHIYDFYIDKDDADYRLWIRFKLGWYPIACSVDTIYRFFSCVYEYGLKDFSLRECWNREVFVSRFYEDMTLKDNKMAKEIFSYIRR